MAQKDQLGQDCFLLGGPGPVRRWLALSYCELTGREVDFLALSRDTTESDLKQRREILNGHAIFVDQPPVRASVEGRVLILEGIEKAERNVLPTLNNLLEDRSMGLEDGRFIMKANGECEGRGREGGRRRGWLLYLSFTSILSSFSSPQTQTKQCTTASSPLALIPTLSSKPAVFVVVTLTSASLP